MSKAETQANGPAHVEGAGLRRTMGLAVGLAVAVFVPTEAGIPLRVLLGYIAALAVYLTLTWRVLLWPPQPLSDCAASEDENRPLRLLLVIAAVAVSVASIFALLVETRSSGASALSKELAIPAALLTLALSWLLTQTIFVLHYAHEFYGDDGANGAQNGGLDFPNTDKPDYRDFVFFAFSIGVANQPPNVDVTSPEIRDLVTMQSVVSYIFNTVVVALAISMASGLIEGR